MWTSLPLSRRVDKAEAEAVSARQRRRRGIRGCRCRHSPCVVFASRQHPPPSTSLSSTSAARPSSASSPLLSLVVRRAWRAPHPFELRAPWPPRGSCPADSAGQMHPLRRRLKAKKKMTRRASLSSSSSLLVRGRSSSQSLFIFEWTLLFLLRIFFVCRVHIPFPLAHFWQSV